jgi:hypothetical protein
MFGIDLYGPDDGLSVSFNHTDFSFCEGKVQGGPPEYINALSSIIMSMIGLYGLIVNKHNNLYVKLIHSGIIMNGIGSCGFHYTNYMGWGMIDRSSMIVLAIGSILGMTRKIFHKQNIGFESVYLSLASVFMAVYFTSMMTTVAMSWENFFDILFALFLVGVVVSMLCFIYIIHVDLYERHPKPFNMAFRGVGLMVIAGIIWILTEMFCEELPIMGYIHGHAFWHLFVAYGAYLITSMVLFVDAHDKYYMDMCDFDRWFPVISYTKVNNSARKFI